MKHKTQIILAFIVLLLLCSCAMFDPKSSAKFEKRNDTIGPDGKVTATNVTLVEYEGSWIQGNRSIQMPLDANGHPTSMNVTSSTDITPAERAQIKSFEMTERIVDKAIAGFDRLADKAAAVATGKSFSAPAFANDDGTPPAWAQAIFAAVQELRRKVDDAAAASSRPATPTPPQ